jgi:hypothetical protein
MANTDDAGPPDQAVGADPAPGKGWHDYGANLARRGYKLGYYLTGNPEIDAPMRAGFDSVGARPPKPARQPRNQRGKRGKSRKPPATEPNATPDLFGAMPAPRRQR